ncbi:MAG: hypothetical protein KTR32_24865 [Granulosicoccus sp.]|nr:hypothetical protein [Granulosicoccus sp.]
MNVLRLMLVVPSVWFAGSLLAEGAEQQTIKNSSFHDWSAYTQQHPLSDGSVLSEYVALTYSGSKNSQRLEVAFIPRFECTPVISLIISTFMTAGAPLPDDITVQVDGQTSRFPILVDEETEGYRYTYNASGKDQKIMLGMLDTGDLFKLNFKRASINTANSDSQLESTITFSLLGSRKSTQAALGHCLDHTPIPFEPN